MHTPTRPLAPAAAVLGAAALALGLLAPAAATAQSARQLDRSAQLAEREQQRATRAAERATRAAERRSGREQERVARRATREQERAARRGGGGEAASERSATDSTSAAGGETEGATPTTPARPATGVELKRCSATIESSSSRITAGETVKISGKLSCPSGVSVAERRITVSEGTQGTTAADLTVLGVATTEVDGSYELTPLAFDTNTTFRVRIGNRGARAAVKVAPVVTLNGPSPAAGLSAVGAHTPGVRPTRATFSGTVKPGEAGGRVSLQVAYAASGEQWSTVAFGNVGSDGSYSLTHRFRTAGQASVRVLAHMRGHNVVAASESLTYDVAQQQNPKLTIGSSAAPLTSGQSTTIGGVAAEAANQTVTLLAHTHAGNFAPVATVTADASGNYSFLEAPIQNTYYRVSAGAIDSTVLYEGVERALTLDPLPSVMQAGQPVTFTGALTPADEGQTAYAERENPSGIGFHIVASATIGSAGYSISHIFANAGSYTMRIRIPADPLLQTSTSAPFTFEVAPAAAAPPAPEAPAVAPSGEA